MKLNLGLGDIFENNNFLLNENNEVLLNENNDELTYQ
tara:strand:+ start:3317 stop:3427 length:111 start_codon:yes stop_codon:yes gene_type:complete